MQGADPVGHFAQSHPERPEHQGVVFRWPRVRILLAGWEYDARALLGWFCSRAARPPCVTCGSLNSPVDCSLSLPYDASMTRGRVN